MEPKLNLMTINTCNPLTDFKPMPKMESDKPLNGLVYCDYLAAMIKENLSKQTGMKTSKIQSCLLYTSPSPRDGLLSRMPSSA